MSFKSQLIGFLKRNLILKLRNKGQLFSEIYNPTIILIILVLFNSLFKSDILKSEKYAPETFQGSIFTENIFVYPNDSKTQNLLRFIVDDGSYYKITYFDKLDDMKDAYLSSSDNTYATYWGIEFSNLSLPNSIVYTLYIKWDDSIISNNQIKLTDNGKVCRLNKTDVLSLNSYRTCAGNKFVYNGLSLLQRNLDYSIKKVLFKNILKTI
jgi:hypothetical protein